MNKLRNEKGNTTRDPEEIQKIIRPYYKMLYSVQLEKLDEMDNFLGSYQIPKLNQDQVNDLNSPIPPKEIKQSLIVSQPKKKPRTRWV